MRIALTTSVLSIPPTYFVVEHARRLSDRHEFEIFALLSDVRDPSITLPIHDFAALSAFSPAVRRFTAPFAGRAMSRAVTEFGPQLVHQHFATWSGAAIAASRRQKVPLVVTLHGYDVRSLSGAATGLMSAWHRRNVRAAAERADLVLSVSRYLADEAIAGGFDPARLEVHYQGIDTDYYSPGPLALTRDKPRTVTFVGALEPHKGPLEAIQASLASMGHHEHRLVIVGAGSLLPRISDLARQHPHIEVRGKVPRTELRDLFQVSSALVLPSRRQRGGAEAAGLVLLEAQACGVPVIAYDSGGTREMMQDGVTGILVAEGDSRALTIALNEVLGLSPSERVGFSRAARDFVLRSRSLEQSCVELDAHYALLVP